MSNSYRHTPYLQVTGSGSNKKDKQFANRKLRRATKIALKNYTEDTVLPVLREVSNIYDFSCEWWLYFNPKDHPEWLRK